MTDTRRWRMRQGRRPGFTLVELLVVIGIIAILVAIVLPVYSSAQQRARQGADMANLAGLATAMKLYKNDFRAYPVGSLTGNSAGLLDDAGQPAYSAAGAYNTYSTTTGRKSRVGALFPNYIDEQKSMISPEEDGETALIAGSDPTAETLNGQPADQALAVQDASSGFTSSTYDDWYNTFGYQADGSAIVSPGSQISGGRNAKRLNNRYAPGDTIITYVREHEANYDPESAIDLVVRLGGTTERVIRTQFDWATQASQAHE